MEKSLYKIFEELKSYNTKDKQIQCLEKYKDNTEFCAVLEFLLNKQKKTGISVSKINKELEPIENNITNIINLLNYLLSNSTGKDIDIQVVQAFINQIDNKIIQQFVKEIVTKKYKCGVTAKTVSKIINCVERPWEMRKGYALKDINKQLKNKKVIVTLKIDGFRYPVIKYPDGKIEIRTSSGYLETGLKEIEKEFSNPNIPAGVYDCECVAIGNFKDSTERYNATSKILSTKSDNKTGIEMKCFDYIEDINTFNKYEIYNIYCAMRKEEAKYILLNKDGSKKYKLIDYLMPYEQPKDKTLEQFLQETFNKVVNNGEEGLIIDIYDAPYERKKGTTMFKLKPEITGDFKVIGFEEGTGKYKNTLGAFIIEYKNNTVNIGSGISEQLRKDVWNNKDEYINKLIEVAYFDESHDENGKFSLRLCRFKRLRHDKDPDDISYE